MIFRLCLFGLLLFVGAGARAETRTADPAVVHANAIRKEAVAYSEGYFGEGDNRLHYVEAGKGPLIILYHGFPSFWYSWFDQMEELKGRYRVVAVDGMGAGLSAKPDDVEAYRVANLAVQIDALARHLNGKRRFTLIGHDWGAALAFAYAQAYPKRLNAVIGMSAPPYNLFLDLVQSNTEQQKRSQYMQLFGSLTLNDIRDRNLSEQIWQQSYGALIERGDLTKKEGELFRVALSDPKAINGGMNWYRANMPPFDQIGTKHFWPVGNPKIDVPALLIWGDADRTFVPEFMSRMPEVAPKISIVHIEGVNHWTLMEQSSRASEAIKSFLRTHRR
jgi:pimeloyl-ACP methyl ester carboxylesterase